MLGWLGRHYGEITDTVGALAALAIPVVVILIGQRFNQQVQKWEASQWRNQELIKARLEYFKELAPMFNDLMCYFTFLGGWRTLEPPQVVAIKRRLDRAFYCAAPLFSQQVSHAYGAFMNTCFQTFGGWGDDARLRTGYYRRRQALGDDWRPEWESAFIYNDSTTIPTSAITAVRDAYDALMRALAEDIELSSARDRYVTADVSINAY